MNKFIIITLFLLAICLSCVKKSATANRNNEYKQFKSELSSSVIDQVPEYDRLANDRMVASFPFAIYETGCCYIIILKKYDENIFSKEVDKIKNKSKNTQTPKCVRQIPFANAKLKLENYFQIFDRDSTMQLDTISTKYDVTNDSCFFVNVPNFNLISNQNTFFDEKDLEYCIFEYKAGQFLSNEHPYYAKTKHTQHGYSSGAIIDEQNKGIAYWLMIW
ncbi:MAG: hypothetical protein LBS01_02855 [Prevotellaceae bacterium]|jgi:hypothetical protein|nr:hypothetical protein [Prevotellaceae bacterium]